MTAFVPAFLAGWLLCTLLLILAHLLLDKASEEVRYIAGAGSICLGCGLAGLLLDNGVLMFGPTVITTSGLVIIGIQYAERWIKEGKAKATKSGEIVASARSLTQELIDQGGSRAERPGHGRQN